LKIRFKTGTSPSIPEIVDFLFKCLNFKILSEKMKSIEEIKPLLESPKKVVITMHQKPDADAMGSWPYTII
jgi:hypothetical protein